VTVFLTTHYIEEAEELCDRVAIIDHGKIIAFDTPKRLMADLAVEQRIEFVVDGALNATELESIPGVSKVLGKGYGAFTLHTSEVQPSLKALIDLVEANGTTLRGLAVEGATLEDVFIQLTGRRLRT
jgi:ABC-2 type transport system ATP-binding protein